MNILVLDDQWPSAYSGKALREINIFKKMKKGNSLHFLYIGNNPPKSSHLIKGLFDTINSIQITGKSFLFGRVLNLLSFKPGDYARWRYRDDYETVIAYIKEIIRKRGIDVIHVFSYFTSQYVSNLQNMRKVWDVGDSMYLSLKRQQNTNCSYFNIKDFMYLQKIGNFEQEMIRKYDKTIFVSKTDFAVHKNSDKRKMVVSNGVDLDYFKPSSDSEEFPSLVFTGHMRFKPNVDAVIYFAKNILPLVKKSYEKIRFYIVGAEPTKQVSELGKKDGIIVTKEVKDVRPYLAKASVFVCPVINGGGVKNKVLQAMAMEKPVVTTRLGAEAIDVTHGKNTFISDEPDMFAKYIIDLLDDKELRVLMGKNGRELIRKSYTWNHTVNQYKSLYKELV